MKLCPKCQKQFSDDANFCPVDAARLVPSEGQVTDGDSLAARFTLGVQLGGSRTGRVYRATDQQGGAAVVVKLIAPAVVALPGVGPRLERELKQLERVQSAGVAKVLASGKRGDETWVAYELVDGAQTIAEAITARGPIPLEEAAHLIEVVGEALIEAAQVGVVHRDLAPKNVLFAGQEIKLVNFSLPVPTSDRVPGVPEFVAPEQVDGKPVDQRSNLYSLGALYYYVLTGQTVHSGTVDEVHRGHTSETIKTPSSLAPVPAPVEAVIMRALDRSPTKRFLTVRQFVDEVSRVARGEADPRSTQPMGKSGRPKAELVQTLLGVRSSGGYTPVASPAPAMAAAMAPGSMVSSSQQTGAHAGAQTVIGMQSPLDPASVPTNPTHLQAPAMAAAVAVATPSVIVAPDVQTVHGFPPIDRSPWASPASGANAQPGAQVGAYGANAAAVVAPPVVAAPQAPVVAPPQVTNAPAAKKAKAPADDPNAKGKFRETMWFKKGDLDAQAALAAADERAKTGKDAAVDKADSLPIDERYKDDGSISRGDKDKYSLRTGGTQMMSAITDQRDAGGSMTVKVSEDALIGEMKGGRNMIFMLIVVGVAAISVLLFLVMR